MPHVPACAGSTALSTRRRSTSSKAAATASSLHSLECRSWSITRYTLFRGCEPAVAAGPDGRIVEVGAGARKAAGRDAHVVELSGRVWPGLGDSHLHLEGLAAAEREVELHGARSLEEALGRVRARADRLPGDAWVIGRGWYNDEWGDARFPDRRSLDVAADGRPVFLLRKDGHSAWVSSSALQFGAIDAATRDPEGGIIDRDPRGRPTGILRETAIEPVRLRVPEPTAAELDLSMAAALRKLARAGLTSVHSMDSSAALASLQRLHAAGKLPIRVTYNLPLADLKHAERIGLSSGWGDGLLRIWGVKAFLDGSLGSRTAEMLDGSGVSRLPQDELQDLVGRCAKAELNVCLHAIGDKAVRRALDALEPHRGAWRMWRPRIEHAQCVDPADQPRFARAGVIASMQPIHAVSDRELADREWGRSAGHSYAWAALARAGAVLAFGSDAPVETADPLAGLDAATGWRRRIGWHAELALTPASARRAYTRGVAYAAGMEKELGTLKAGAWCDLTVVDAGRVVATVVEGRAVFRR